MQRIYKQMFSVMTLLLISHFLIAATYPIQTIRCEPSYFKPLINLSFSSAFIKSNHPQTLYLIPSTPEYYTSKNNRGESWGVGLFLGVEHTFMNNISYQLGLLDQINSSVGMKGSIWDFGSPEYNNFNYNYRIQFSQLLAAGKLLGNLEYGLHPYIEAELGVAVNNAHTFTLTPLDEDILEGNVFTNRVSTSFAYGGGVGVDKDLFGCFRIGLGLNIANWGKSILGKGNSQATNQTLKNKNIYNQQVRINLIYML